MSIKKFSKGSIAVYITACLAVLFIFSMVFSPSLQSDIMSKKNIGKVGNIPIDQKDFAWAFESIKNQALSSNYTDNSRELSTFITNETWSFLHTRYSIQAMMSDDGLIIPKNLIEKDIKNDPFFQENGVYSAKKFKTFLTQREMSVDHLIQIKGIDFMQDALYSIVKNISEPIPSEIALLKDVASVQKQVSLKAIDVAKQKVPQPTDSQIKDYYQSHQIDFVAPNQYEFKYAILNTDTFKQKKQYSDEELKTFFNQNIENYIEPEQVLMDVKILKKNQNSRLTPSESNYVQTLIGLNHNLDNVIDDVLISLGNGYELITKDPVWRPVAQIPTEIATDDFIKNKQPMVNSEDDGTIVIIQNKAFKAELVPKFGMVISSVKNDFTRFVANEQFQRNIDDIMDQAYSGSLNWDQIKKMVPNLKIKTTKLTDITGLSSNEPFHSFPKFSEWLETHIDTKDITVKSISPEKVILIEQIKYVPKHVKSYDAVKTEIKQILISQAQFKKTQAIASNITKKVSTEKNPNNLTQSWQYFPKITYAYNDLGYPSLIWVTALQQNPVDTVLIIDELVDANNKLYVLKWWGNKVGPLNNVFYNQLQIDWGYVFANEAVDGLVKQYELKKYINV